MRLKADENFGSRAVELICAAGHEVSTVRVEGLSGCSDENLFDVCRRERLVLLTFDLDFADVTRFRHELLPGTVIVRLPHHSTAPLIEKLLRQFLAQVAIVPLDGGLWIVEPGRIRVHSFD
jgi:predicted nuclease of predicted toxin-antitoxin system